MEPDAEGDRYSDDEEERKRRQRPPSSYGSMESDNDPEHDGDNLEESQREQEVPKVFNHSAPVLPREDDGAGIRMNRPASPETLYSTTTWQTKPPGALVIETGTSDIESSPEVEDEYDFEDYEITNSPEPPEPIEPEEDMQMDIHGQPGRLHPEQDLAHVFKNIQKTLTELSKEDLYKFKLNFNLRLSADMSLKQIFEGDLLDFVDRIFEKFGPDISLQSTISTLENIAKNKEAEELRVMCKKALIRSTLKQEIVRHCQFVFEGVPQPGKRCLIDDVYVEPEICLCSCGGVASPHEFRGVRQTPNDIPRPDSAVNLSNLFRMSKPDRRPVRTVVTAGIAGIGMSLSAAKYCYDWAEHRYNKDLQYVITLPCSSLWILRNKNLSSSTEMSIMDVIEYHHSLCKSKAYLDEEECKFLVVMESFDCYQTHLDWKNTPVINQSRAAAKLDDLIVNLVRGSLLPNAQVWILGRRAAVSQIPSEFIDAFTEIHGFSPEMTDNYMRKHFTGSELQTAVVHCYKQLPSLRTLCRNPFICWMVVQIFSYSFRKHGNYRMNPPKLTPFYVSHLVIQTNRRLQFYRNMPESNRIWSTEDNKMLSDLGYLALKMLERNITEFSEADLKHFGLNVMDVTVQCGMCTELPPASSGQRRFCFIHTTFQEFLAALYVFVLYRVESKNALDNNRKSKTSVAVVQSAVDLALKSPMGQYDMFLRFLCGLIAPDNNKQLAGNLFGRSSTVDNAVFSPAVVELVKGATQTCPAERMENLKECLREMTQSDN